MRYTVRITANFDANLASLGDFLAAEDAKRVFDRLLEHLLDALIPNLEQFPRIGRDFLALGPLSEEGRARLNALKQESGADTEIREYIAEDDLILYAVRRATVFLLAIRHHRQLSFDLRGHWT